MPDQPPANRDLDATWHYHDGTKHPSGYLLDHTWTYSWEHRPYLFKEYTGKQVLPVEVAKNPRGLSALDAIAAPDTPARSVERPGTNTLARLLFFSAGITKTIDYGPPAGEIAFRAPSCTGALYHIEVYVVCADLPGLEAGVYHFDPREPGLVCLRAGDFRRVLVDATGGNPAAAGAPLTLLFTDVFWRNAVKYQAREYRHAFWDSGTMLSQTLAMAAAHNLPAPLMLGFVDDALNRLLDLDTRQEATLALVPVGTNAAAPPEPPPLEPLNLQVRPVSATPWGVQAAKLAPVLEMHAASSLTTPEQVRDWRGPAPQVPLPDPTGPTFGLEEPPEPSADALERVIVRRGSSRRFHRKPITRAELALILRRSTAGIPGDFGAAAGPALNQLYLIVHAVEDLPTGSYAYHPERARLEQLRAGDFRETAGYLALGQDLAADAAANIYWLSPLEPVLERFGNRGYRAAQMEAAVMAGRVYLAAYAQHLGATGLTFYDDEVTQFFSPHAADKQIMFLMAVGQPARRPRR